MGSEVLTERRGAVLLLTISDPPSRNTLSAQVVSGGIEALGVAEFDDAVRAIVLCGAGDHFSAGGNVHALVARRAAGRDAQRETLERLHQLVEAIRAFPKPVIAAVEGIAAGAGFALALAADLIVAARDSRFVVSHGRLGLSPDGGTTWSLVQSLPRSLVQQMVWLGEPVGADALHAARVVNWIVDAGQAVDEALRVADRLVGMAPNAIASAKDLVQHAASRTLHQQLGAERDCFVENLFHPNAEEGLAAFLAKRTPHFS